jgi:hypothetical protein
LCHVAENLRVAAGILFRLNLLTNKEKRLWYRRAGEKIIANPCAPRTLAPRLL